MQPQVSDAPEASKAGSLVAKTPRFARCRWFRIPPVIQRNDAQPDAGISDHEGLPRLAIRRLTSHPFLQRANNLPLGFPSCGRSTSDRFRRVGGCSTKKKPRKLFFLFFASQPNSVFPIAPAAAPRCAKSSPTGGAVDSPENEELSAVTWNYHDRLGD